VIFGLKTNHLATQNLSVSWSLFYGICDPESDGNKKKKHLATLPRIGGFQWQKSFFGVGHFVER
jgi:hypothetical protein